MTKFSDLDLDPKVLKAVEEAGYETPTPIQAGAIPPALEGRDVLGIAQTGTGKTAAFTLPVITRLQKGRARARMPRSLVLAPTRELAAQVAENFDIYAKYTKLTKALLIGGVSFKEQDRLIDRGVDVLIATPGRLLDHFERGKLLLTGVQIMVVDEADRMLDMGFIPDIERIFKLTPFTRQTLFFSATMAPEIERITNTFLSAPVKVEVARAATTGENIEQGVVMFRPSRRDRAAAAKEKRALLRALIEGEGEGCSNAIIFCNRKADVDVVAKSLKKHGYKAEPIHGDLEQSRRMEVLQGFRDGTIPFLVASDVAARGLDIPNVSHVFNYDVPSHAEDYVHRIGRTGRAGRSGKALMICAPQDEKNLAAIERLVKQEIPRLPNPLEAGGGSDAGGKEGSATEASASETSGPEAPSAGRAGEEEQGARRQRRRRRPRSRRRGEDEARPAREETDREESAGEETASAEAVNTPGRESGEEEGTRPASHGEAPRKAQERTPRSGHKKHGRQEHGGQRKGDGQRKSGGQRKGGGKSVVGMGDHMPDFIARSFSERNEP